jgi:hypothetical protein
VPSGSTGWFDKACASAAFDRVIRLFIHTFFADLPCVTFLTFTFPAVKKSYPFALSAEWASITYNQGKYPEELPLAFRTFGP